MTAAQAKLADARFAAYGDTVYPDATFTLRISYGKVAGWNERGQQVPTRTVMGGTFDRATGAAPFDLPAAFIANRAKIDGKTTYDFVTTNDIIGGNSGSPVIDRQGRVNVPQHLRGFAGLEGDALVLGSRDHAEIWAPARWEEYSEALEDPSAFAAAIAGLGI